MSLAIFCLLLGFITLLLYALPFIPALLEWKTKADSQPFIVDFSDRTLVDYSLRIFRDFIQKQVFEEINTNLTSTDYLQGKTPSGMAYSIVNRTAEWGCAQPVNQVMIFNDAVSLKANCVFKNKVFAKHSLKSSDCNRFSELFAQEDLQLGKNNEISHSLFSEEAIFVDKHCQLRGWAKSTTAIHLNGPTTFQYLQAPWIFFGQENRHIQAQAKNVLQLQVPRKIFQKATILEMDTQGSYSIVAKNNLTLGERSILEGNIKCRKTLIIKDDSKIFGALIAENNIIIGRRCFVQGPIIAGKKISVGGNCMIGTQDTLTSLVGEEIVIEENCVARGLFFARRQGQLVGETPS